MKNTDKLIILISKYEDMIEKGNLALKKAYKVDKSPLFAKARKLIPASGELNINGECVSFHFHGWGCLFNFNGALMDFDYGEGGERYEGFEVDKLFQFIKTYPNTDDEMKIKDNFIETILALEQMDKLRKKPPHVFGTYQYSFHKDS